MTDGVVVVVGVRIEEARFELGGVVDDLKFALDGCEFEFEAGGGLEIEGRAAFGEVDGELVAVDVEDELPGAAEAVKVLGE